MLYIPAPKLINSFSIMVYASGNLIEVPLLDSTYLSIIQLLKLNCGNLTVEGAQ